MTRSAYMVQGVAGPPPAKHSPSPADKNAFTPLATALSIVIAAFSATSPRPFPQQPATLSQEFGCLSSGAGSRRVGASSRQPCVNVTPMTSPLRDQRARAVRVNKRREAS
jgi:hypothetical protein